MENKYNFYPFNYKGEKSIKENKAVIKCKGKHLCGYVVIHNRNVPKAWQGNYNADALQYLAIHGGLTYCTVNKNYTVFGFDCAHAGDDENIKLKDFNYVMQLTEQMEEQILSYKKALQKWRKFGTKRRCKLLDKIRANVKLPTSTGLGEMIDMLSGGVSIRKSTKKE